jgi:hypothetical protein
VVAVGAKVPVPEEVQTPFVAELQTAPPRPAVLPPEQMVWFPPALAVVLGRIVMLMVALACPGPGGKLVKVSVVLPAEISAAQGV